MKARIATSRTVAVSLSSLGVLGLAMAFAWDTPPLVTPVEVFWGLSITVSLLVGLVLAFKVQSNIFGWLMMVGSGLVCWGIAFDELGLNGLDESFFTVGLIVLMSALLVFPTGRHLNRFWKWAHIAALLSVFVIPRVVPPDQEGWGVLILFLTTVGELMARLLQGTPTERRQVGLPVLVLMGGFALSILQAFLFPNGNVLPTLTSGVVTIGFPVAIGVSILRYRLFDIDRIVSRTVGYALVMSVLGAVYAVGAVWLPAQMPGDSPAFVAGSTLAVAALFSPLRRRVLGAVDRRFYRSRYNAMRVIEEFSSRLRDQVDLDKLTDDLLSVIDNTMRPSTVGIWVRQR